MAELPSAAAAWAEILSARDAAAVVTDEAGTVVRWGATATRLYGYGTDEARGRCLVALLGDHGGPDGAGAVAGGPARPVALVRRRACTRSGEAVTVVGATVRVADDDGAARFVLLEAPAAGRPGPDGELGTAMAERLRLVGEARAAHLAADDHRVALDRLRDVAARVAAAPRLSDLAAVAAVAAQEATGAGAGGVWLARRGDGVAELQASVGFDEPTTDALRRLPLDASLPVPCAIATAAPVWVANGAEREDRFPGLAQRGVEQAAVAAVPLVVEDGVLGALAVYFDDPRTFRRDDRALIEGIGSVTASAVSRTLALQASEAATALLGTAMASAPVGFAFLDRQARFVKVNSRLVEINGVPEDGHVGRCVEDVLPELAAAIGPPLHRVLETGEPVLGVEMEGATSARPGERRAWVDDFYPVLGDAGEVLGVGVVVRDVTESRRAAARLALLAEATGVLTASLDPREVLDRLAGLVVDHVADLCTVLLPEEGMLRRVVARHRDPDVDLSPLLDLPPVPIDAGTEASEAYRTGRPVVATGAGRWVDALPDQRVVDDVRALGLRSALAVPLGTPRATFGVLSIAATDRVLGDEDLALAVDLATRAGGAFENATRYERERSVAEALQRAVVPDRLPAVPGLSFGGCYDAATSAVAVGGDWYDVVPVPGGRVALVVGDIGGHGLRAAAAMGQLRNAVHAWLLAGLAPDEALLLAEPLLGPDAFATVGIVVVDPATGELTQVSAGHPPAVLVVDGVATLLPGGNPPIGAGASSLTAQRATLPPGGLLVLYTDGLVEVRGEDLTAGLARLTDAVVGLGDDEPGTLCQKLLRDVRVASADDACVLVVRRE